MKSQLIIAAMASALLTPAAVAAPHEGGAFVKDYDTNGDGQVSRAEFDARRPARFKATDANGDGVLDENEYVGEYTARLDTQLAASTDTAEKKTEQRQRQLRQTHVRFDVLDTSKDKRIDKAEYDASGVRAFAEQDKDKDGTITTADVAAQRAEWAERQKKDR